MKYIRLFEDYNKNISLEDKFDFIRSYDLDGLDEDVIDGLFSKGIKHTEFEDWLIGDNSFFFDDFMEDYEENLLKYKDDIETTYDFMIMNYF